MLQPVGHGGKVATGGRGRQINCFARRRGSGIPLLGKRRNARAEIDSCTGSNLQPVHRQCCRCFCRSKACVVTAVNYPQQAKQPILLLLEQCVNISPTCKRLGLRLRQHGKLAGKPVCPGSIFCLRAVAEHPLYRSPRRNAGTIGDQVTAHGGSITDGHFIPHNDPFGTHRIRKGRLHRSFHLIPAKQHRQQLYSKIDHRHCQHQYGSGTQKTLLTHRPGHLPQKLRFWQG
ncbi:hypothetical protein SDC9_132170 [bioreactor metagenome]|uniref:Uncharacterized protein n=1 Tax=bioreactor metagenome TaxID=1076179 RepID=A0A645D820_9ZZZZ